MSSTTTTTTITDTHFSSIKRTQTQDPSLDLLPTDYHDVTPYTTATLNYWKDSTPIPLSIKETLTDHQLRVTRRSEDSPNVDPRIVNIKNIRGIESAFSLSENGFEIVPLSSKMSKEDWSSEEKRKEIYFAEVSSVLKKLTGAKFVHSYEHMVRRKSLTEALAIPSDGKVDIDGPVRRVHIDESPSSARREFRYYLNPSRAENEEQRREYEELQTRPFGIYNIWKPLKTIRRDPLCFCEPRSLRVSDLRAGRVTVPNVGEIENFAIFPPKEGAEGRHQWHFLKGQRADEAIVFKIYDSRDSRGEEFENEENEWGLDRFGVAHTSFVDPGTEGMVETRESCEVRSFCVF